MILLLINLNCSTSESRLRLYVWPKSTVLETRTSKMLLSSSSSSSVSLSPSMVPPMTIAYSMTSVSSTFQGVGTESLPSQTTTPRPVWENIYLGKMNPYDPYGRYWYPDTLASLIPTTCGQIWSASFIQWVSMGIAKSLITWSDEVDCVTPYLPTIAPANCATRNNDIKMPPFPFTPSPPCCSRCSFTAGDVQVYHWPQSSAVPSASLLVNSNGFTL